MKLATRLKSFGHFSMVFFLLLGATTLTLAKSSTMRHVGDKGSVEKHDIEILPDERVSTTRVGNWEISDETAVPVMLYQVNHAVDAGTPEQMARQYLRENAGLLGFQSASLKDLVHQFTREGLSGATVRFQQTMAGMPVYGGEVVVHINPHNVVTYVINDYKSRLAAVETTPTVSLAAAQQTATKHLGVATKQMPETADLQIYHNQGVTRLVYHLTVNEQQGMGAWESLVDAHTGKIVRFDDLRIYYDHDHDHNEEDEAAETAVRVDGNGHIFDPDPLTSATATYGDPGFSDNEDATSPQLDAQLKNVTLRDITQDGGQFILRGPYASIQDVEAPFNGLFMQSGSTFNFNRNDDAFEAVNTYYHIDASMRYINETLGITLMPHQYTGGVHFDPHGVDGADQSFYSTVTGTVVFGEGGVDDAEDSDVIHHELGHGLHDWVTNGNLSQVDGLSEGSGDYWAQSYNRSIDSWTPADPAYNHMFRWDGHNEFWGGRITNYDAHYPEDLVGQIHTDGQIWATCLMKVWDSIGQMQTDKIFLEGLALTNGSTSQDGAANASYQAAVDMGYSPTELQSIRTIFSDCGYTLPSLTISVTASPDPVQAGGTLTYMIDVANGSGGALNNVTATSNIPTNSTYVADSATCNGSESGGVVTFPLGTLADGINQSCTFEVVADSDLVSSVVHFSDDMEDGATNWSASANSGSNNWMLAANNAHSPTNAWFAENAPSTTDQLLTLTDRTMVAPNSALSFWHHYDTEGTFDGGVVEISINDGQWSDLGSAMTQNGYNSQISPNFGNPLAGRSAFSGSSGGYVQTIVDLSAYAGEQVQIRFRLGTDESLAEMGWYVDDVAFLLLGDSLESRSCVSADGVGEQCVTVITDVDGVVEPPEWNVFLPVIHKSE